MSQWGATRYGDPCRECGFGWDLSLPAAMASVAALPLDLRAEVVGASGAERVPELHWSVGAYVCHIGDNLHIWAERLMGVVGGCGDLVPGYDENELARARSYDDIALPGALWSLERAADAWSQALTAADAAQAVLVHPDRGVLAAADVARLNAHDGRHHLWDITRILSQQG